MNRRSFLTRSLAAAAVPAAKPRREPGGPLVPPRTFRWGQTNITERDPVRYDIAWWRCEYWKRTEVQGRHY